MVCNQFGFGDWGVWMIVATPLYEKIDVFCPLKEIFAIYELVRVSAPAFKHIII